MTPSATPAPSVTPAMVAYGRTLGEPRLSPNGESVAFVNTVQGRGQISVITSGQPEMVLTTDPAPPGAQAYGGGVFDWLSDGTGIVYIGRDGCLYQITAAGGPAHLLAEPTGKDASLSAPCVSGSLVTYVQSGRDGDSVLVLDLQEGSRPWPRRVATADFCFDPVVSASGRVAWHEWSVPDMAWDGGRIRVADIGLMGTPMWVPKQHETKGGGPSISVGQPRFSSDMAWLAFTSDESGWANVWRVVADPSRVESQHRFRPAVPVLTEEHEHADPSWGQGQRSFAWSPDGTTIALNRNEGGFGRLVTVSVETGAMRELSRGVHGGLSWRGQQIACLRSGARTPTQIAMIDPVAGARTLVARGPVAGWDGVELVEPEIVHWRADDGTEIHGRLYRSAGPNTLAPMLCWVHGGPTSQWPVTFRERFAYFVAKGWSILVPDHRGSTGWGRAYTQAMRHRWGELDVEDTAAGIRHAILDGWCDPHRVAIIGGSAGGFTVLGVLGRHPNLCAAGVDLFGVADLLELNETTHRFERHYNASLVGPLPDAIGDYRDRSPVNFADRITAPLLILQGSADPVVPLAQSTAIADRLRALGRTVEMHVYDGEGHGWNRPDVVIDEITRTEDFLRRHVLR